MLEQNLGVHVIVVLSFVEYHYRNEINESHRCHLILIDLSTFDGDKLVADIFTDVKLAVRFQNMGDHEIVISFK
jgi:hypothetical protein